MPSEKTAVRVYVSADEHEQLRALAADRGLSVSSFAHSRLFDEAELPVELRVVLMDFAERIGALEDWYSRAKAERAAMIARRSRGAS